MGLNQDILSPFQHCLVALLFLPVALVFVVYVSWLGCAPGKPRLQAVAPPASALEVGEVALRLPALSASFARKIERHWNSA